MSTKTYEEQLDDLNHIVGGRILATKSELLGLHQADLDAKVREAGLRAELKVYRHLETYTEQAFKRDRWSTAGQLHRDASELVVALETELATLTQEAKS